MQQASDRDPAKAQAQARAAAGACKKCRARLLGLRFRAFRARLVAGLLEIPVLRALLGIDLALLRIGTLFFLLHAWSAGLRAWLGRHAAWAGTGVGSGSGLRLGGPLAGGDKHRGRKGDGETCFHERLRGWVNRRLQNTGRDLTKFDANP